MSVRLSLAVSFGQRYLGMVLAIAMTAILARLLTPADFGLFGIAFGIISIITLLCEFGVAPFLVQHRKSGEHLVASAFWFSVGLSWFWCVLVIATADVVAAWFQQPALAEMLRIMALALLVEPFVTTMNALLQRSMRFGAVAAISLAGAAGNLVIAVVLAMLGFGATSLAWGYIGLMASPALVCLAHVRLFPLRRPHISHIPGILSFGGTSTLIGVSGQIGMMLPNIVIGRTLGLDAAGFYNRGFQLFKFVNRAVVDAARPVALATLSRKRRAQEALHEPHLLKIRYLSVLCWPMAVFLLLLPELAVHLVLGGQWSAAAPVVQICSLMFLLIPLIGMNYEFYIAVGRLGRYARQEVLVLVLSLIMLIPASLHSIEAVALTFVLPRLVALYMTHRDLHLALGCRWLDVWAAARQSLAITAVSAVAPLAAAFFLPERGSAIEGMTLALGGFGILWLSALFGFGHPLGRDLQEMTGSLRRRLTRGRLATE